MPDVYPIKTPCIDTAMNDFLRRSKIQAPHGVPKKLWPQAPDLVHERAAVFPEVPPLEKDVGRPGVDLRSLPGVVEGFPSQRLPETLSL